MSLFLPKRKPKTGINIVPLVDVLIVLIFFFLMTMQFKNENMLNITPPKVETAGPKKSLDEILIAVNKDGTFYYNQKEVSQNQLVEALELAAEMDRSQKILLTADEDTALKHMTFVMDTSRRVGLEKVRLQTR